MTPPELLGVVVRAIGILMALAGLPAVLINPIVGALYFAAGIVLVLLADAVVRLSYWNPLGRAVRN